MGRTRPYTETIKEMAKDDPGMGAAIIAEASELFLSGDVHAAKIMLRDFINATMGFQELADEIGKNPKSIMRMLSAKGNPTAVNLGTLFGTLQKYEGTHIECHPAG